MIFPRESTPPSGTDPANENWRDQVASRVNSYRQRRGRKLEGEFSMRFDFEPDPDRYEPSTEDSAYEENPLPDLSLGSEVTTAADEDLTFLDKIDPIIAPPPQDPPAPDWTALSARAEEPSTNVIEFPRSASLIPAYEVAEPVLDKPRILDVPEQPVYPTISGPLFADLSFAELTPQKPPEEVVGPPVPIATIRDRALATLIDTVMVAIGIAGFLVVALHFMNPAPARTLLVTSATAAATVWFIYEYLFVVKGAATVGMKLMRLQLVNFSGQPAGIHQRRYRALALPLSAVSLLGFLWAFADEDSLCWHDRMSQTYLSR